MTNPQEDILINSILDGEPAADAWNALEGLAAGDPALWRRVAQAQHDHAVLVRAFPRTLRSERAIVHLVGLADVERARALLALVVDPLAYRVAECRWNCERDVLLD